MLNYVTKDLKTILLLNTLIDVKSKLLLDMLSAVRIMHTVA